MNIDLILTHDQHKKTIPRLWYCFRIINQKWAENSKVVFCGLEEVLFYTQLLYFYPFKSSKNTTMCTEIKTESN